MEFGIKTIISKSKIFISKSTEIENFILISPLIPNGFGSIYKTLKVLGAYCE